MESAAEGPDTPATSGTSRSPSEFGSSTSSSEPEFLSSSSAAEPLDNSNADDASNADDDPAANAPKRDHVSWIDDEPVAFKADILGRDAVAMALEVQLRKFDRKEAGRSFLVHIDGPWGAGKSTLMQFVRDRLARPELFPEPAGKVRWLAVPYDAWRQSKAGPPWLTLLEAIRRGVRTDRGKFPARWWFSIRELGRLVSRWQWIAAAIICLVIAGLVGLAMNFGASDFTMARMGDVTKFVAGTLSAIAAVAVVAGSIGRFAFLDSNRAAKAFMDNRADPMEDLAKHFGWVLSQARRPILLLIDDLDRCPETHVVELLETIQKLLRDHTASNSVARERLLTKNPSALENARTSLVILVAADGRWVKASYDNAYASLANAVSEPGASIGSLFLQKLFQLTLPVPRLSNALKGEYIAALLADEQNATKTDSLAPASSLAEDIERAESSGEVLGMLEGASEVDRLKVARRAIELMVTDPKAQVYTQHVLEPFAELVDPIPRSVKRYVMAYSMLRAVRTAEGSAVTIELLALWTVVVTRWPMLGDYLQRHPEAVDLLDTKNDGALKRLPPELVSLFTDPPDELLRVIKHSAGPLNAKRIRTCSGQGKRLEARPDLPTLPKSN